jgi:hypothetical protein
LTLPSEARRLRVGGVWVSGPLFRRVWDQGSCFRRRMQCCQRQSFWFQPKATKLSYLLDVPTVFRGGRGYAQRGVGSGVKLTPEATRQTTQPLLVKGVPLAYSKEHEAVIPCRILLVEMNVLRSYGLTRNKAERGC